MWNSSGTRTCALERPDADQWLPTAVRRNIEPGDRTYSCLNQCTEVAMGSIIPNTAVVPVKEVFAPEADDDKEYLSGEDLALKPLREKLLIRERGPIRGYLATKEFRKGSAQIRAYAKLRARGICENCDKAAPFKDKDGEPFLEVHHINRLADDGPDIPGNVAAICPNCHREAHFCSDTLGFRERLGQKIGEKEACLDKQIESSPGA